MSLSACASIEEVNPRPTVAVEDEAGPFGFVLGEGVKAEQEPSSQVTVYEFRKSLQNGFRNMVGSQWAGKKKARRELRLTQADLEMAKFYGANYITIRYRGGWYERNKKITSVAGIAQPRNPTETGDRHLEDVIEVMFEQTVAGLERARGFKTR